MGKCHKRFIKKISQLKSDTRSCRCNNFSLKVVSVRSDRGGGGGPDPPDPPLQNSSVFTQQIKQHSISSKEVMVSFDVKSLFTFIPVDLALSITKERLQRDQNLAERTNLSVDNILRLSDFVLNHNYFKYDGDHYKQIFGCAMGSPISPVLADLVMEEIEETAISTFPYLPKW